MTSDSSQPEPLAAVAPVVAPTPPRARDKARIRFSKGGDLRLVSHRDLLKCFERVLRRAELPIHHSQGFHPMPRMVLAQSLGLGIIGHSEVLELEFDEPVEPADLQRRLIAQMPPGLRILSVGRIPVKSSAQVRRAGYRVTVPGERAAETARRIDALLEAKELWVERTRPAARRFDLRPLVSELRLSDQTFEMLLWVTPNGAARPDEVLTLLGLGDLVEAGVPLERHVLELHDETHDSGPVPEVAAPSQGAAGPRQAADKPVRPTALVSGPMNFDT
jgi:radical SAM-linked protein